MAMATPKKRLDTTITNLATRLDATTSPKPGKANASPKPQAKSRAGVGTPTRKKVELCDKGQNIYNRICKDLIHSTRTPTKEKAPTPSKFFKSRITTVAAAEHVLTKSVPVSICNEPQEYITDVVKVKKVGRKYKKNTALVETVMPLYNIQAGIDAQEHVEIIADIVEEVIERTTRFVATGRKMRKSYSERTVIRDEAKVGGSEGSQDFFILLGEGKKAGGLRKRKGSPQKVQPSKRSKIVYNNADGSDDDDVMVISTSKPIISADDKKEMDEILGMSDEQETLTMTDHEASKQIVNVAGKKRKEGAQ